METCLWDLDLHWLYYLSGWYCHLLQRSVQPAWEVRGCVSGNWRRLRLKLKPSRCEQFQGQIAYLGHKVSAQGIATDESKIEVIKKWPVLTNIIWGLKFLGIHGLLLAVYLKYSCTGSLTPAQVNLRWECWQEKGCHQVGTTGANRPLMTWRDCASLHMYPCLHRFQPSF